MNLHGYLARVALPTVRRRRWISPISIFTPLPACRAYFNAAGSANAAKRRFAQSRCASAATILRSDLQAGRLATENGESQDAICPAAAVRCPHEKCG